MQQKSPQTNLQLLWLAMLGSTFSFYAIVNFGNLKLGEPPIFDPDLKYVLIAATLFSIAGSLFTRRVFHSSNKQEKKVAMYIVSLALSETITVFAFTAFSVLRNELLANILFAVAAGMIALNRPVRN